MTVAKWAAEWAALMVVMMVGYAVETKGGMRAAVTGHWKAAMKVARMARWKVVKMVGETAESWAGRMAR